MYLLALAGSVLCVTWFDWKLLLLFFIFIWANNIDLKIKEEKR